MPVVPGDARDGVTPDIHYEATLNRERQQADQAEAREAELRTDLARQGRELTAALLRTAIAETEARALREALKEARRSAWRRCLRLA